jgi:hypothetical protein
MIGASGADRVLQVRTLVAALLLAEVALYAAGAGQQCTPQFPFRDGWFGADAGYSIPLASGQTLWLFGDSFVGTTKSKDRSGTTMVNSTIGISSCAPDGKFTIRYVWAGQDTQHPQAIFPPVRKQYKYWAMHGFTHGQDVYVALEMIRDRPDLSGALNWEGIGTRLVRIRNVERPFAEWKITYFDLYRGKVFPGIWIVKDAGYVYLFSPTDTGDSQHAPTFLTRFPEAALDAKPEQIKLDYLARDDSWKHVGPTGIDFGDAKRVMDDPFGAGSVWYEPTRKYWIAIGQDATFRSNQAVLRTAPALFGPWSPTSVIYRMPEANPNSHGWDKDTWCYAAMAHPEYERDSQTLITYTCNSSDFGKVVKNLEIYVPRAVYVDLP